MRPVNLPSIVSDYPATESVFQDSATGLVPIALADPARWSIAFNTSGFSTIFVSTRPGAGANEGLAISGSTGMLKLTFAEFPGLVGQAWYLIGTGTMNKLTVLETFMKPRTRD